MKKIYFTIDDKGYLTGYWESPSNIEGEIELDIKDDHDFFTSDSSCWKYENDTLIFDEERQQQLINERLQEENKPSEKERLEALENALLELILRGDDDD